jgi:hypothetical protein
MRALLPLLAAAALARAAAAGPQPTFVVDSLVDVADASPGDGVCETGAGNGVCTVRGAIQEAGAVKTGATVRIPAGTYALSIPRGTSASLEDGDLELVAPVTIQGEGPGVTILDGNDLDAVFWVASPGVVIRDLTVRNGQRLAGGGIVNLSGLLLENVEVTGNEADLGGGILNDGDLVLRNSVVHGNTAATAAGGIYSHDGTASIVDSMILDNTGPRGGGILNVAELRVERSLIGRNRGLGDVFGGGGILSDGELTVVNSTIARNEAEGPGGGIAVDGGNATLIHVLLVENQADVDLDQPYADDPGGQLGGGIWVDTDASVYLRGSAVAINRAGPVADECGPGSILSGDYNLIGFRRECVLAGQTAHVNSSDTIPNLQDEGLASNGGFAWDFEPGPDSLLVDAVPAAICVDELGAPLAVDGRGYARKDGLCDIGPHELGASRAPETILGAELVLNGGRAGNELGRAASEGFVAPPAWLPYWAVEGRPEQILYDSLDFPPSSQTPPGSGSHFFAGGATVESTFHQIIDVSAIAARIDEGTLPFHVSAALGGYLTDGDYASVHLVFQNEGGLSEQVALGPVTPSDRGNQTKLIAVSDVGVVPVGTRTILVGVRAVATDGAYNDGYADDVSLVVPEPSRLALGLAAMATLAVIRRLSRS